MFYKLIIFDPTVDPTYTNLIMTHFYDLAHYKYLNDWFWIILGLPNFDVLFQSVFQESFLVQTTAEISKNFKFSTLKI